MLNEMTFVDALALFSVMGTLAIVPSTSVALVVTRSATLGFANGAAVSLGIVLGDLIFASLAILGLTTLSGLMGTFFFVIKYVAASYLIWLGIGLLRNKAKINFSRQTISNKEGLITSFLAGLVVTLGDVKAIFFYASLFPNFVDLSLLKFSDLIAIAITIFFTVGGVKLFYAWSAKKLVSLSQGLRREKEVRLVAGSLMVGTGAYLIFKN